MKLQLINILMNFMKILNNKNKLLNKMQLKILKKGTNYVLKESENLRVIKVSVGISKDFTSEIKQDF